MFLNARTDVAPRVAPVDVSQVEADAVEDTRSDSAATFSTLSSIITDRGPLILLCLLTVTLTAAASAERVD